MPIIDSVIGPTITKNDECDSSFQMVIKNDERDSSFQMI